MRAVPSDDARMIGRAVVLLGFSEPERSRIARGLVHAGYRIGGVRGRDIPDTARAVDDEPIDLVLLHVDPDGRWASLLKSAASLASIVVVGEACDPDELERAIRLGAVGYVEVPETDAHLEDLARRLRCLAEADYFVYPEPLMRRLVAQLED